MHTTYIFFKFRNTPRINGTEFVLKVFERKNAVLVEKKIILINMLHYTGFLNAQSIF